MTETFCKTENYKTNHSTFGGIIYSSDFNTSHNEKTNPFGSSIAKRILSDMRFDIQCKRNREFQNRRIKQL